MTMFWNIALAFALLLICRCGVYSVAGGTSTSENGFMAGIIVNRTGLPVPSTRVMLFPADYDPVKGGGAVFVDTTGSDGRYIFSNLDSGSYNVVSVNLFDKKRGFVNRIHVAEDTITVSADTLQLPGTIKVVLPAGFDSNYGYFFIPGTSVYSWLSDNNGYVILDSVPAQANLSVYYAVRGSSAPAPKVVRDSVMVAPGGIMTLEYVEWKFSKKLVLNTTASGADVVGNVMNFPALVRLTNSNFKFSEAKSGGEDIRFTKSDGSPLSFEIERWDASQGSAEIWVKVDTVYGNDSTHSVTMYWGNPGAAGLSNSIAVFDTVNGFQGVWHLSQSQAPALDATKNHFDGILSDTAPTTATGAIGNCRQFNGTSNYIWMPGTASGKLNFPEQGSYAVSAWVYEIGRASCRERV
jgi:hypothetical protein